MGGLFMLLYDSLKFVELEKEYNKVIADIDEMANSLVGRSDCPPCVSRKIEDFASLLNDFGSRIYYIL